MNRIPQQILFGWPNQDECSARSIWHVWGRAEYGAWVRNPEEKRHL